MYNKLSYSKKGKIGLKFKQAAAIVAIPVICIASASAAAPDVTGVVSDIGALMDPVALVGGAYIGLKIFQRGWTIIRGFI